MTAFVEKLGERLLRLLPSRDEKLASTFDAYCDWRFDRVARSVALGIFAFGILWWPTDLVTLSRLPEALLPYARWRIGVGIICLLYVILPRIALVRRHVRGIFCFLVVVAGALVAYLQTPLGGPETPWFHLLYTVPFISMPLPLRLKSRVLFTSALSAASLGAYLLPVAAHRASPFVTWMCSFFLATTTLSILFGHVLFEAFRDNFRQARALAEHSASLERRVAERTKELRRLVDHVERARDAERRRVARDLHDDLGQELVALRYAVSHCEDHYRKHAADHGAPLAEVQDQVRRTSASMRALLNDLRPVVLDELGLVAAADWLLRRTERRTGLRCSLRVEGEGLDGLDANLASELYRIVQESLTNVVRHAGARRVEVCIRGADDALDLSVTDDGIGLGKQSAGARGFGLIGMRERACAFGGTLTARTRPEGGTEIRCRLPLPRTPQASEALSA